MQKFNQQPVCVTDPYTGISDFVNYMIQCPDLQSPNNAPVAMDTCATYMSHMHDIRYTKKEWEDIIYPLYIERFALVRTPKI